MTKQELKKEMLEEKQKDLLRLQLSEEYLKGRIKKGELARKNLLEQVQEGIKETKKLVEFFKKWRYFIYLHVFFPGNQDAGFTGVEFPQQNSRREGM